MAICLQHGGNDLHMVQLTPLLAYAIISCFIKTQNDLNFLVLAYRGCQNVGFGSVPPKAHLKTNPGLIISIIGNMHTKAKEQNVPSKHLVISKIVFIPTET